MTGRFSALLDQSGQSVAYMIKEITHICRSFKNRGPGSEGERRTAEYFAGVLRKDCGCADVKVESFSEHPGAFYGFFWFTAALCGLCALSFFLQPWLSIFFGLCTLLLYIFQFTLYKQVIDPLFPKRQGTNVTAVRPCGGEVRRRVLLNGHMDAAWEFPLNYHCGGIVFEVPGVMCLLGVCFYVTISICALGGAGSWTGTAGLWGLLFLPFFAALAFTYDPKRIVDGANDDLTGCMMGVGLLREMERLGVTPEHTELGVILTGSEEAGLRGAKAWCKKHRDDYGDVPTYIVSYDTIHDPRFLMVNELDLNGTVRADADLCGAFLAAAEKAGVPCKKGWVPPLGGATDSAAFTQGGFCSVGVTGLDHKLEDYYHTRRDSYDNLDEEGLENCYRATVRFLEAVDEGGLDRAKSGGAGPRKKHTGK